MAQLTVCHNGKTLTKKLPGGLQQWPLAPGAAYIAAFLQQTGRGAACP